MPTIAGRTLVQLRQAVGYNVGGPHFFLGSTTSAPGDDTSVIDTKLRGGNDQPNQKYLKFTTGTLIGELSRVSDYVQASTDITVSPAFSGSVPSGATYELWGVNLEPARVDEIIRQSILSTYGRAYDPQEDISLHTAESVSRYDIPSGITALSKIYARTTIQSQEIHACEQVFDESVDADVTVATDTEIKRRGNSSVRFTVGAGISNGDLVTDSITSLDISKYDFLEGWVRSSVALAAGDVAICLDDTANCASPLETVLLPATIADTDTFFSVALSAQELNTAIISVGFEYNANAGANVIWLDDLRVVRNNTAIWERISQLGWSIDKEAGDIIFEDQTVLDMGYVLLKLVGGDSPLLLTNDSDVNEVDDWYVIAKSTELAFAGLLFLDPAKYSTPLKYWALQSAQAYKKIPRLRGLRTVG